MLKTDRNSNLRDPSCAGSDQRIGLVIVTEKGKIRRALRVLLTEDDKLEAAVAEFEAQASARDEEPRAGRASRKTYLRRLPVRRSGGVTLFVRTEEIDRVEAANQYMEVHTRGKKYLVRQSMRAMEERLDPRLFMRIHRSTIVNLERVQELRSVSAVDRWVVLADGSRHRVSQGRWDDLRRALLDLR